MATIYFRFVFFIDCGRCFHGWMLFVQNIYSEFFAVLRKSIVIFQNQAFLFLVLWKKSFFRSCLQNLNLICPEVISCHVFLIVFSFSSFLYLFKACFWFVICLTSLRQIRSIKGCLTMNSLKTLASALVLSRIDYDNMALVSLPKVAAQSIQSIINTTARLITGVRKYDHITPVLKELHWLKIDGRIEYKVALQMYKCLSNEGPAYLTRDLVPVLVCRKNRDWDRLIRRTLFPTSTS